MGNRPIKKWRSGNIEVAVWSNEKEFNGGLVEFKTISLSRSYKKKDEEIWRNEVINLRRGDIPKIMVVLQKAQEELLLNQEQAEEEGGE
ncbi:MAG: hypothetical protein QT11_C0001G0262 [archaeon GW2011_AR20]|nr:MAG: hypothetical protein QT11_C0001G0262 [archaeon GW2011_AR20]AQS28432.1 hypothetical protein [uncultured archaeon]MBS3160269.1 hypothetical protein [Candidatus Woesearchaeota archaeon]